MGVIANINTPVIFPTTSATTVAFVQYSQDLFKAVPSKATSVKIPDVPFYSQFADISSLSWQKRACGIASLAMLIDFYKPDTITPQQLLVRGINSGAYTDAGWSHQGLANLASKYGLKGKVYDLSKLGSQTAFNQFKDILKNGPVMVSIYYKFDPKSTIPHLVVINGVANDMIYYNDPAAKTGEKKISIADFMKGWKKRFITVRPTNLGSEVALNKI